MYVILGATGHVGGRISDILLTSGKKIRVISRSLDRLKPFMARGAEAFAGDVADSSFLIKAFAGANAVFSMIPPNIKADDVRSYQNKVSVSIEKAIRKTGITHVVNLSSVGAHLENSTGPVKGLHDHEIRLNTIKDLNIVHLRPTYFMENLESSIDMIRTQGVNGSAIRADLVFPLIATRDIGDVAARYLLDLDFTGRSIRNLLGPRDVTLKEVTEIIGKAIGVPGLKYMQFAYGDVEKALTGMGLSLDMARAYVEMSRAFNDGLVFDDIIRTPDSTTPTSLEEYAKDFARIYCADDSACLAAGF